MKNLETGLTYTCPDMSEVRMRVCRYRGSKTPFEYIIGAFMYCVSKDDHTSASLLRSHRRCVDEDDEQKFCRLCRPDPFESKPLRLVEAQEEAELLEVV